MSHFDLVLGFRLRLGKLATPEWARISWVGGLLLLPGEDPSRLRVGLQVGLFLFSIDVADW